MHQQDQHPNSNQFTDFSIAGPQSDGDFELIPKGTIVPVNIKIQRSDYNNPRQNLMNGVATESDSGSVYVKCEATVTGGEFMKRKIFFMIGLYSPKGPTWGDMGKAFIRGILESNHGISSKDESPAAIQARRPANGLEVLDGIEFIALVDIEKGQGGYQDKNVIKRAITAEHPEYANYRQFMRGGASGHGAAGTAPINHPQQGGAATTTSPATMPDDSSDQAERRGRSDYHINGESGGLS